MSNFVHTTEITTEWTIPGSLSPSGRMIKCRMLQKKAGVSPLSYTPGDETHMGPGPDKGLHSPNTETLGTLEHLRQQELAHADACCLIEHDTLQHCSTICLFTSDYTLIYEGNRTLTEEEIHLSLPRFLTFQDDGSLTRQLIERNLHIATMESCTSGLIASTITDYEGASAILKGSLITYSNEAKIQAGVDPETIRRYGVYSAQTARAMAYTAKKTYNSDIAIGITGTFSNPDPANSDSCAGEIYYQILTTEEHSYHMIRHDLGVVRKEMKKNVTLGVLGSLEALLVFGL